MKMTMIALIITLLGISCEMPDITVGSMDLSINNISSRTLTPDISMDANSYVITGNGPESGSFTLTSEQEMNLVEDLRVGDWIITIEALNPEGLVIGRGSETVNVIGGATVTASILVTPLEGNGALDLTVSWNTEDLIDPLVSTRLIPFTGPDVPLVFSEDISGVSNSTSTVEAGYYTLILQLLDTETVVMGAVETVYIAAGQTTSGLFDFSEVNNIGGTIGIEIDVDLNDPIELSLAGTLDTMVMGSTMSVTATAPLETVSIIYSWYINGSTAGSGSSVDLGSALNPGIYRLDIIGQTEDGSRSGSINHTFTVTSE
ncbi:MAG: hypothetical protein JEY91_16680 [Spirochaetaceae bacterium]|nr:hypothetical protein [Spirochaetaceae bacterium]